MVEQGEELLGVALKRADAVRTALDDVPGLSVPGLSVLGLSVLGLSVLGLSVLGREVVRPGGAADLPARHHGRRP